MPKALPLASRFTLRRGLILGSLVVAAGLGGCQINTTSASTADAVATSAQANAAEPGALETERYAEVLATHVNDKALVDYETLQQNRQALDSYNASLASITPAQRESWSEAEQIAYWVNAYNSLTLASIIDQAPLKASIKDIKGVWKGRKHAVSGDTKTLDQIEHETLRKDFQEPRIHAALVCAALSCPPLRQEPFTAEQLDAQLEDQVNQWLANPETGLRIDRENNQVYLSKIFKWFGEDWVPGYGTENGFTGGEKQRAVLNFVSNYVSAEDRAYLEAGDYSVSYMNYDWSLNRQS